MPAQIVRLDQYLPDFRDTIFGDSLDHEFRCQFFRGGFYIGGARIRDGVNQLWGHEFETLGTHPTLDSVFEIIKSERYAQEEIPALIKSLSR